MRIFIALFIFAFVYQLFFICVADIQLSNFNLARRLINKNETLERHFARNGAKNIKGRGETKEAS
jgi:hypothetical protein